MNRITSLRYVHNQARNVQKRATEMIISRKYARKLITTDGAAYQTFACDGERDQDSVSHDVCTTSRIDGREYGILTDYKRARILHVSAQ